jgi:hypothetical protein
MHVLVLGGRGHHLMTVDPVDQYPKAAEGPRPKWLDAETIFVVSPLFPGAFFPSSSCPGRVAGAAI